LVILVEPNI